MRRQSLKRANCSRAVLARVRVRPPAMFLDAARAHWAHPNARAHGLFLAALCPMSARLARTYLEVYPSHLRALSRPTSCIKLSQLSLLLPFHSVPEFVIDSAVVKLCHGTPYVQALSRSCEYDLFHVFSACVYNCTSRNRDNVRRLRGGSLVC